MPSYHIARWNANVRLPVVSDAVPVTLRIDQNYPNPFSGVTTLRFALDRHVASARLEVFDLLGRRVATLHDGPLALGNHDKVFDAGSLPSGVYFCRLSAGDRRWEWDIVLVR